MNDEKVYQFNEYVLGYDKGLNDRSCLTISKIQNGNVYVISSIYDESADVISTLLDNLQQEIQDLKRICELYGKSLYNADLTKCEARINEAIEYIEKHSNSFSVLDTISNGELLDILKGDNNE